VQNLSLPQIQRLLGPAVLLAIPRGQKAPKTPGWQNKKLAPLSPQYLAGLAGGNVGVLLGRASGNLVSIDMDDDAAAKKLLALNPWLKNTLTSKGKRGVNFWLRIVGEYPALKRIVTNDGKAFGEFRADGAQTVIYGVHPEGMKYTVLVAKPPLKVAYSKIAWPADWRAPSLKPEAKTANPASASPVPMTPALEHRIRAYLSKMGPAIQGEAGDNHAFKVACILIKGFNLTSDQARPYFEEFNETCNPPWSGVELDNFYRKLECANEEPDSQPRGYLLSLLDSNKPRIELPGNDRHISEFAEEVGLLVAGNGDGQLFKRDNLAFTLNSRRDALSRVDAQMFRTFLEILAVPYKKMRGPNENYKVGKTLSLEDAAATLASPFFLKHLPEIRQINSFRAPVIRLNGEIELLAPGYDKQTEIYTTETVTYADDMSLPRARKILSDLFSEFVFSDAGRSRSVAISAILTLYAIGLLPSRSIRPAFIFCANDVGAGKGTAVKATLIPICGHAQAQSFPREEAELRKILITTLIEAKPYLFFDNLTGHLHSPPLEAFLTSGEYRDRILGENRSFAGDNITVVMLTGNALTVSPDMRRRSLFIDLFIECERPEDRHFKNRLDDSTLLTRRPDILAAAWALIRNWMALGRPKPSIDNSSFPAWSDVIGGIVQAANFDCPLERPSLVSGGDSTSEDINTLAEKMLNGGKGPILFTASDLIEASYQNGLFPGILTIEPEMLGNGDRKERQERADFGLMLRRFNNRVLSRGYKITAEGKGHGRKYLIERVKTS